MKSCFAIIISMLPVEHAEAICQALITEKADFKWGTGDLRPAGITDDFCRLMEELQGFYANLAIELASERCS